MPYISDKNSVASRNGKPNCCPNIRVLGVHTDGGMQQKITVPADILLPANNLSDDQMAIVEPLAIGAHAVRRADVKPGETVAVVGCGPIGIGIMKLAQIAGAKVIAIGVKPNGLNINKDCGSSFPRKIRTAVKKYKAHIGISLDGDADRIIMCDEKGNIVDGDQIIAALATRWKNKKMLRGGVVGTLMSNYGLEKYLKFNRIKFLRANVGDRYVKEKMQKYKFNLGGEQSGHIILGKFATTGDGLLVALEVLFALRKGKKTSEFFQSFKKTPQLLENITVKDKNIINKPEIKKVIKLAEKLIHGKGRVLVRKSGTESKIRVMVESDNKMLLSRCVNMISKKIK